MAAPEGDVTIVQSKPSRLAPLKKSPTSKASVETFFRVPNPPALPAPPRSGMRARPATAPASAPAAVTLWLCAPGPGWWRGLAVRGAVCV